MPRILAIDTPTLGDRSYLVYDGRVAFVVGPQRDIDRVVDLAAAESEGVRISHVFETHIHNDYVTGGHALAALTGAVYHINADDRVTFGRVGVRHGHLIAVGDGMRVRTRRRRRPRAGRRRQDRQAVPPDDDRPPQVPIGSASRGLRPAPPGRCTEVAVVEPSDRRHHQPLCGVSGTGTFGPSRQGHRQCRIDEAQFILPACPAL